MSEYLDKLADAGIHLGGDEARSTIQGGALAAFDVPFFSGYGEFTPISVRPYAVRKNADVERD